MEASTALDVHPRSISARARGAFDSAQVELIKRTVAKDCTDDELLMFLELCARYELDPFAGQIYAAKMGNEDGARGRVSIIVGRDGFLTIAERHPEFEGYLGDVVHENDRFLKLDAPIKREDGLWTQVQHSYGRPNDRGEIIGAWVEIHRTGRPPFYFYADKAEYKPRSEKKLRYSPWSVQESVMMFKCALTTGLRHSFNITGLIGEEEASRQLHDTLPPVGLDYGDDPWQEARLKQLFDSANETRHDAFPPAKVKLLLDGCTDDVDRRDLILDLESWHRTHDVNVPEAVEVVEGDAHEEPEPEVAEEPEPEPE